LEEAMNSLEKTINDDYLCKRVCISMQRGTALMIKESTDKAGVKNFSKWAEEILRRAAARL